MLALLLDGPFGKGFRLESLVRDRYPTLDRSAVRAPYDAVRVLNVVGWATMIIMGVASIGLIVTTILG